MINHILVPLDGSSLAECVLPHVIAIAPVTNAHVTLLHVLEHPDNSSGNSPIDPMGWHMQKQELQAYLEQTVEHLQTSGLDASQALLEGKPAESIIDFARVKNADPDRAQHPWTDRLERVECQQCCPEGLITLLSIDPAGTCLH